MLVEVGVLVMRGTVPGDVDGLSHSRMGGLVMSLKM